LHPANVGSLNKKMTDPQTEMLLQPDRLQLMPIRYEDIWAMYKQAEAAFWVVEEVDLGNDRRDFETLSENEKHYISHVLAFFATADGIVFDNLDSNFGEEVQVREAKSFYAMQKFIEGIHNEMYSIMIDRLIAEPSKRQELFDAVYTYPALRKKAEWCQQYMDRRTADFGTRLLAFIIVEYIFFSASFASIFYFRKRNKMHGLCFSNELISRDEGLHAMFGCLLFNKYLVNKPDMAKIHKMVKDAVDIELEFVRESLPVSLMGMNADSMSDYVRYVADHMLTAISQPRLYNVVNPYEWMSMISLQDKTNFFEKKVSAYSKAGVGADSEKVFKIDEDF
jgi:ribonucleoside-diphosphate reductase beta chain